MSFLEHQGTATTVVPKRVASYRMLAYYSLLNAAWRELKVTLQALATIFAR